MENRVLLFWGDLFLTFLLKRRKVKMQHFLTNACKHVWLDTQTQKGPLDISIKTPKPNFFVDKSLTGNFT